MKKVTLLVLGLILLIVLPSTALAWDDCPRGSTCSYPGQCSRYVDANEDGICDHGQVDPNLINQSGDQSSSSDQSGDQSASPDQSGDQSSSSDQSGDQSSSSDQLEEKSSSLDQSESQTSSLDQSSQNGSTGIYHLSQILAVLTLLYITTHFLSKKGILRLNTHRRFWNIALLLSFLISAFLGIILIIEINFSTDFGLPFDTLFWHVETGIAMGIIGIFHVIWHWHYFKKMIVALRENL